MCASFVNRWTQEEDEVMRQFYHLEGPSKIIARLPGRSIPAAKGRSIKLGCVFHDYGWSDEDERVLREYYPTHGQAFVAAKLHRSRAAIKGKAQSLGLKGRSDHRRRVQNECGSYRGHHDISKTHWNGMRTSAAIRNMVFDITIEYAWDLYERQGRKCALSGVPIRFPSNRKTCDGTASLDRIDSSEGYTITNVQWVHRNINHMKWDLSQSDFIDFCHLVANLHTKTT